MLKARFSPAEYREHLNGLTDNEVVRLGTPNITAAREAGCYKLIATSRVSRPKVHALRGACGFANYGIEFRLNF